MANARKNLYLGIDIGGSNTKIVVIASSTKLRASGKNIKILEKINFKTPHERKSLVGILDNHIDFFENKYNIKFLKIGIAVAGVLNSSRTRILNSPNMPKLNGFALQDALYKKKPRKYVMNNDANIFVYAEAVAGVARGSKRVIGLTLGTGVGSGYFVDGKIETGAHGGASEIGHSVIVANGIKCTCGGRGHVEDYISSRFFHRNGGASAQKLAVLARQGNKRAKKIFDDMAFYLGCALANIVNFWDPEVIVIGGGIAEESDMFLKKAVSIAKANILSPEAAGALKVRRDKLGPYAGAIGSALVVMK